MYEYIKGVITEQEEGYIVIENNDIGYLINCPFSISVNLGTVGDKVTVFLYQSVREDDISLYGFASKEEKEMFLLLITVSGIGPKVAHGICSSLTPEQLAMAVLGNNVKLLTSVKGLGKKTAERIVLELKDKLKDKAKSSGATVGGVTAGEAGLMFNPNASSVSNDAISALVMLGYKEDVAQMAVAESFTDGIGLEELIKLSLKRASGNRFA